MRAYVLEHDGGTEGSRLMNAPGPWDIRVDIRPAGQDAP